MPDGALDQRAKRYGICILMMSILVFVGLLVVGVCCMMQGRSKLDAPPMHTGSSSSGMLGHCSTWRTWNRASDLVDASSTEDGCCEWEEMQVKLSWEMGLMWAEQDDVDGERRKLARASWICLQDPHVWCSVLGPAWGTGWTGALR